MAWVGTGVIWTIGHGGILSSRVLGQSVSPAADGDFSFVQISDSHIGFSKEVNKDVTATLQIAIDRINAFPARPDLLLHTGDITHLSKPQEFDAVAEIVKAPRSRNRFMYLASTMYLATTQRNTSTATARARTGRLEKLYASGDSFHRPGQRHELAGRWTGSAGDRATRVAEEGCCRSGHSTPIVVFAHVPLWSVYPKWGWGTEDSARHWQFSSVRHVTVLNGHIHQVLQKIEGNVTFHTACSTAFPQPEPGKAESPGPLKHVPAGKLKDLLGLTRVDYSENHGTLAIVDANLT